MKQSINYLKLTALALSLMLASCLSEERNVEPSSASGLTAPKDKSEVILSLRVPGSSPATRALSTEQENTVTEVDVLVFDRDLGTFLYSTPGKSVTANDAAEEGSNPSKLYDFSVGLIATAENQKVDLWVIANARPFLTGDYTYKTKDEIAQMLVLDESSNATQIATDALGANATPIPMWGILPNISIDTEQGLGSQRTTVYLTRMVARIDVELALGVQEKFSLTSVHFYNRNINGRLVPRDVSAVEGNWESQNLDKVYAKSPSLPEGNETPPLLKVADDEQENPASYSTTDTGLIRTIYAFEAGKGEGYDGTNADGVPYKDEICLVIGGEYEGGQETFYRVDFVADGEGGTKDYLDLLRNHLYAVSIQSVSGPGFTDKEHAREARPVNMTAGVQKWNEGGMNHVVMDDQYMLSVSSDIITFYGDGGSQSITAFTDWPEGWTIDTQATDPAFPTWLTITEPTVVNHEVKGNTNELVTLTMAVGE
ncbi:MAG: FimB/Mfa2 family fimbrial subunit, partial [Tannerellaceae bacterium]|nr:FimB/Mfa2 family fimbrial subunit [Tannerellaceae bacterium]